MESPIDSKNIGECKLMTTKIKLEHVSKIFGSDPKSVIPMIEEGKSKHDILEETGHTVGVYDASLDIRSEEHTSELQSRAHLVCRLLPENITVAYLRDR